MIHEEHSDSGDFRPSGAIIADRYVLTECLGIGSSAVVYKCHLKDFPQGSLVIKVLHSSIINDQTQKARFQREIASTYKIEHRNVIRTYEYVEDRDTIAYTMEYADNGDLRKLLQFAKQLEIEDAIWITLQICSGLQAIHDASFIHRDIKPENIFFTKAGNVKVADFGVIHAKQERSLTATGEVIGTINYISPEYLRDGILDNRSDIYAVGLILYEMLTGKFPFVSAGPMKMLTARLYEDPPEVARTRRDCPAELNRILLKALAREKEDRYQSAEEMYQDLKNINGSIANSCHSNSANSYVGPLLDMLRKTNPHRHRIKLSGEAQKFGPGFIDYFREKYLMWAALLVSFVALSYMGQGLY